MGTGYLPELLINFSLLFHLQNYSMSVPKERWRNCLVRREWIHWIVCYIQPNAACPWPISLSGEFRLVFLSKHRIGTYKRISGTYPIYVPDCWTKDYSLSASGQLLEVNIFSLRVFQQTAYFVLLLPFSPQTICKLYLVFILNLDRWKLKLDHIVYLFLM